MGLFKQIKGAAPSLMKHGQAQARERPAAQVPYQQAQAQQQAPAGAQAIEADFEPIAGVTLEQYVKVNKGLAAYGYDPTKAPDVAASMGIDADSWQQASEGWNWRLRANPGVAQQFNAIYRAA